LLDRNAAQDALEMVVSFAVQDDEVAVVKSDLIKAARVTLSDRQ